jgi:hypothetical protein
MDSEKDGQAKEKMPRPEITQAAAGRGILAAQNFSN